jgi:hypothetical protein
MKRSIWIAEHSWKGNIEKGMKVQTGFFWFRIWLSVGRYEHETTVFWDVVVSAGGELAINAFQNLAGSEDSDWELTI